ncbi:sugar 3,4-ketoisomerase [Mongoliitalea daihaiensis]|uniref:sugar 3,4-ketoisomerase n=1 Tax=Mongoliitalea daihaiensis TaxID=2782006 RepID=UPI001F1E7A5F|nr:FdtA/QdtA family cupin domain-containing protein [Mongoliitalea daihaiensis]UJP63306.1 FdtA/QdtA family cupin domain-containing protein [Mongoliitalea daihaiensis]
MKQMIERPYLLDLPSKQSTDGWITFAELGALIQMPIKRIFWIKDVPKGAKRGVHAHTNENQLLVCLAGSVHVSMELLDGTHTLYCLNSADQALYLPAFAWSELTFQADAVLLVLSDQVFDEDNYIREKSKFKELQQNYEAGEL